MMMLPHVCLLLAVVSCAGRENAPEWENHESLSAGRLPPRAWFGSFPDVESAKSIRPELSPRHISLDSEDDWRFRWSRRPEARPSGFFRPDYDVSGWDVVKVPCSWQAMGIRKSGERFGVPIYVNQHYIFTPQFPANSNCWPKVTGNDLPADWTFGKDDNPVGSYRRDFTVPADWIGDDIILQFDGVESFFRLWVNGEQVGYSKNSRSPAAFDVTRFVKAGVNSVSLEVYRNCDGSYLESQDIFRLSGIIRHVSLTRRPKTHLADVAFTTAPVVPGCYEGAWKLSVRADVTGGDVAATAHVFDAAGRCVLSGALTNGGTTAFAVGSPKLWSAEEPNLYTLVVSVDRSGRCLEAAGFQLGFCESTIRDAADQRDRTYIFNGKPIKLKGVNRGECDPLYGHHVPDSRLEEDIRLIKQGNFNHIRNSHMPQPGYFYFLCNKYGIYVMDEANLEAHGFFYGKESISHEKSWEKAFVERQQSMYEWNKNFPCVVIWSMGNEAGPGDNFRACYDWLKSRDGVRPVQYERNNWITDMGSRQYPSVQWMWDCAKGDPNLEDPSLHRPHPGVRYPFHVNEYAHNFNNNCGNLMDYQEAIESSDRIMGGALWDWADQALWMKWADGRVVAAWGGCFGERPENGQGIMDGIVTADRRTEPGYHEAKHVFQPVSVSLDGRDVVMKSKFHFRDTSAYGCKWTVYEDGSARAAGTFDVVLRPQETLRMPLPEAAARAVSRGGREVSLRVAFELREDEGLSPKGWIVAEDQMTLVGPGLRPPALDGGAVLSEDGAEVLSVATGEFLYTFSRTTGELVSLKRAGRELLAAPMALDCFRVPVGGETHLFIGGEPDFGRMRSMDGLREMRPALKSLLWEDRGNGIVEVRAALSYRGARKEDMPSFGHGNSCEILDLGKLPEDAPGYLAESVWRFGGNGCVDVTTQFRPFGRAVEVSRLGWRFVFSAPETEVEYFARGPIDNYPDRKTCCFPARYHARSTDFGFMFGRSQDSGTREEARFVTLETPSLTFSARGRTFSFAVSPYSPTELIRTSHPELLPKPSKTELGLYAKVRGLGSANCGPPPLPRDTIAAGKTLSLALRIGPAAK